MARKTITYTLIFFSFLFFQQCNIPLAGKIEPVSYQFNEDSAYEFIAKQVSFGSRVPNTPAHDSCAQYLISKLKQYGSQVSVQNATVYRYDSLPLNISNIIGVFYPDKKKRILLFSHWDSRFVADNETNDSLRKIPILGANDGASGVGVLLEIARKISQVEPNVGVDIIFFDAEDQGEPAYLNVFNEYSWGLGAQYWAKNKHFDNYLYGINLDMVGGKNARFYEEDFSRFYYGYLVRRIWKIAQQIGYSDTFITKRTKGVIDDHFFVNQSDVRSILIIHTNRDNKFFPEYWHTHNDNMQAIDKQSLKKVGQLILTVIYNQK